MSTTRRLAAIDIGTVTTRLLIADVTPGAVAEVARSTDITHLGEGLAARGHLSAEAVERVRAVIERYAATMSDLGVEAFRAVATSASRDADNGEQFARMLARYGVEPEIVSGEVEARLAFAGATHDLVGEGLLVNDIGGGSTELVLGSRTGGASRAAEIAVARSIDVGSRRLTERFFSHDPPAPAELDAAERYACVELSAFFEGLSGSVHRSIALAGTATTLSAIRQGLAVYDSAQVHHSTLGVDEIRAILDRLAALPLERRAVEVVGLDPGRAPVIVAGTIILLAVLDLAGLDSTLVSEHDILYGIVLDLYARLEDGLSGEPGLE